jgi:formate dehydrogenase iron-sulfur subunit
MCYDRLKVDLEPACAKACPTKSIQFGPIQELKSKAEARLQQLHADGVSEARLYGADERNGVGGTAAFFLLLDDPEVYRLPSRPVTPTRHLRETWKAALLAAGALAVAAVGAALSDRK